MLPIIKRHLKVMERLVISHRGAEELFRTTSQNAHDSGCGSPRKSAELPNRFRYRESFMIHVARSGGKLGHGRAD